MKYLLEKIREVSQQNDLQAKCVLIEQFYNQINARLGKVDSDLDVKGGHFEVNASLAVNMTAFDAELDQLEAACDKLIKILNPELQKVLKFLKPRFESHMYRHQNVTWEQVENRLLEADPKKLWSLGEMERTGGEPDVTGIDQKTGQLIFQDRSPESPFGRKNCCYDKQSEEAARQRRLFPNGNAVDRAAQMGVDLLDEEQYREAQEFDQMDHDSWSWLKTPVDVRERGVALYGLRTGDGVSIGEGNPRDHDAYGRFRALLRI